MSEDLVQRYFRLRSQADQLIAALQICIALAECWEPDDEGLVKARRALKTAKRELTKLDKRSINDIKKEEK